jgi:SOS response regulatory protein OraA/RecX
MTRRAQAKPREPALFDEPAPCITALVPAAGFVRVKAGRRTLATLVPTQVQTLQLAPGTSWTPDLQDRAESFAKAREGLALCVRWLRTTDRSTHELRARLLARGYSALDADASLTLLASTRLQSDDALAARTENKLATAGASDAKISRSLAAKGLASRATETGTRAGTHAGDAARALTLARVSLAKPGTTQSRVRRALGALARAEYDEEVAREAVRQAAREMGFALSDEHG